jgi:Mn-dependent DtxR family transcriptional regulator
LQHTLALFLLRRQGLIAAGPALSELGHRRARQLIRSHRLWETYGQVHMGKPLDDLHYTAESLEHITNPDLQARLADRVDNTPHDPHGHDIPEDDEEK